MGGQSQIDTAMALVEPTAGHDPAPGEEVHTLGAVSMGIAEQRCLPATEGVVRHRHRDWHVDADHADLDLVLEPTCCSAVIGEAGGAVAVGVIVDQLHASLVAWNAHDAENRSEGLLLTRVATGRWEVRRPK